MVDGITIGVIGLVFGVIGVALALYSIIKQKKLETRIKEKEKLKDLSRQLDNYIIPMINNTVDEIDNPTNNYDLLSQLQMLAQEIVSKAFDEKKEIVKLTTEIRFWLEDKSKSTEGKNPEKHEIEIENEKDIVEYLKYLEEGKCPSIVIDCTLGSGTSYDVNYFILWITSWFSDINKLETDFGNLMEEFKPDLIQNLKDSLKEILTATLNSAIGSKEMEVNTQKFSKTEDIGLWIYRSVNGNQELISPLLDRLKKIKIELENLRETLVMTSYT